MKFKDKESGQVNMSYMKLKSGEQARGIFMGEPYEFKIHWHSGKSNECQGENCADCANGNRAAFRFKINFVTKENEAYVAKVFEQGRNFYDMLKDLHEGGYDLEQNLMCVTRKGETKDNTTYSILPVPNGKLTEQQAKVLSVITLNELGPRPQKPEEPPIADYDGNIPF